MRKIAAMFSFGEVEAARREWSCSWSEAFCRLLEGQMPASVLDHYLVHMFPDNASRKVH
jgi:hypothetical protein